MNINITIKNLELTPAIKEYIEKKMNALQKFMKDWVATGSVQMHFDLGKNTVHHHKGNIYYAEANLQVPGTMIRAQKNNDNLYAAIDATQEVLIEAIKEYKNKLKSKNIN